MHKSLDEFEFKPDPTTELLPLERLKNQCIMFFVTSVFILGFFSVNEWSICFSEANSNYFQGKQLTN